MSVRQKAPATIRLISEPMTVSLVCNASTLTGFTGQAELDVVRVKTDKVSRFKLTSCARLMSGEIRVWYYTCQENGWTLTIYND